MLARRGCFLADGLSSCWLAALLPSPDGWSPTSSDASLPSDGFFSEAALLWSRLASALPHGRMRVSMMRMMVIYPGATLYALICPSLPPSIGPVTL